MMPGLVISTYTKGAFKFGERSFGDTDRLLHVTRLAFAGNPGDDPQSNSGQRQNAGNRRETQGSESYRIVRNPLPEGFALLALVVFCVSGAITLVVMLGISWWCGWLG